MACYRHVSTRWFCDVTNEYPQAKKRAKETHGLLFILVSYSMYFFQLIGLFRYLNTEFAD